MYLASFFLITGNNDKIILWNNSNPIHNIFLSYYHEENLIAIQKKINIQIKYIGLYRKLFLIPFAINCEIVFRGRAGG